MIPPKSLGDAELLLVLAKIAEAQVTADQLVHTDPMPVPASASLELL
ncbi:hypothetical protein [Kitasatospora sp. NPDC047058]